jgi:unsaturated rhamnogalacturonyl hydrolase
MPAAAAVCVTAKSDCTAHDAGTQWRRHEASLRHVRRAHRGCPERARTDVDRVERARQQDQRKPLDVARVLAMRYPASPIMSYIPALSWSGALRLSKLTKDSQFADRARREMQPFISGEKPAIAEPYQLTSLAGHLAIADLAVMDGNAAAADRAKAGADFMLPDNAAPPSADLSGIVRYPRQWTDDMFMASAVLSRAGGRPQSDLRYAATVGRLLTAYAEKLQRPDGVFIHAIEGPFAWGRGNGFAAFGLAEALEHLPASWADRPRVLDIFRKHMRGMLAHQAEDGMWRQVVDEPTSYKELTVTAMTVAVMARGMRLGWLDKSYRAPVDRAWQSLLARIGPDGSVADVCSGTGAGETKEYYMTRPATSGGDDRGGAMALTAALEMAELSR